MEKEEGRGRKSGGRRSHVFLRSRSTWFVRASMWANNAHFGSNRDALHSVHYSVHVSMWPGRGRGYTLPPSSSVANNIAQPETTHASTVHAEGFSSAPATVERPLECHSSKFATRQVASSRMALPASSSGDEVEGNPLSQTGRGLGDQIFGYPPRDGIHLPILLHFPRHRVSFLLTLMRDRDFTVLYPARRDWRRIACANNFIRSPYILYIRCFRFNEIVEGKYN